MASIFAAAISCFARSMRACRSATVKGRAWLERSGRAPSTCGAADGACALTGLVPESAVLCGAADATCAAKQDALSAADAPRKTRRVMSVVDGMVLPGKFEGSSIDYRSQNGVWLHW